MCGPGASGEKFCFLKTCRKNRTHSFFFPQNVSTFHLTKIQTGDHNEKLTDQNQDKPAP